MGLRRIGFLGTVTLLLASCLAAQSPNGIINGLVLDPAGRAIAALLLGFRVGSVLLFATFAAGNQRGGQRQREGIFQNSIQHSP